MTTKKKAKEIIKKRSKITPKELAEKADVSRQQASKVIKTLKENGKLIQIGKGPQTRYITPDSKEFYEVEFEETLENEDLREDEVVSRAKLALPFIKSLPENVERIFDYAFSEMLNNAIEHSNSDKLKVEVGLEENFLTFRVRDFGVGVFKNVMDKKSLNSQLEAIQDLLKGKTTTASKAHSGEGIFFTSKVADIFALKSFDYEMRVDNLIEDVFVGQLEDSFQGTEAIFRVDRNSEKELEEVFKDYQLVETKRGFDKTEIVVKLFQEDVNYVSRSQARRILVGLDKFEKIILDFEDISGVGQAFVDEIFRVFENKHSDLEIETKNTNEAIEFMIDRNTDVERD